MELKSTDLKNGMEVMIWAEETFSSGFLTSDLRKSKTLERASTYVVFSCGKKEFTCREKTYAYRMWNLEGEVYERRERPPWHSGIRRRHLFAENLSFIVI